MPSTVSTRIVASIPGRLRIGGRCLKNSAQLKKLEVALTNLDYVCSSRINPAAGSLVLFYDAGQCAREEMESVVTKAMDAVFADFNDSGSSIVENAPAVSRGASISRKHRTLFRQANRYAKYVMYASLGISLVLAARGARRGHALAGAIFVGALGVHLAVHRKHLLS